MAITDVHLTGFETGSLDQLYSYTGGSMSSSGQRTGSYQLQGANDVAIFHDANSTTDWCVFRGYFYLTSAPSADTTDFFRFYRAAAAYSQVKVYMNINRTLYTDYGSTQTSSQSVPLNQWVRIECWCELEQVSADGRIYFYVDDTLYLSITDSIASGHQMEEVKVWDPGASGTSRWDDCRTGRTGSTPEYFGAGQIERIYPNGDSADTGENTWFESTGSANYAVVDEVPYNGVDYSIGGSSSTHQLWALTVPSGSVGTLGKVMIWSVLQDTGGYAGPCYQRSKVSGGSAENSSDIAAQLLAVWEHHWWIPPTQPTAANLSGYQMGMSHSDTKKNVYCAMSMVEVDYTPPAGAGPPRGIRKHVPRMDRIISALGR